MAAPSPSSSHPSPPSAAPPTPIASAHRLSLSFAVRLLLLTTTSFVVGGGMGSILGGRRAAFIFTAENAHRTPKSQKGWYFYHKTKNYRIMYGGLVEGARYGARMAGWVAMFCVFEDAVDRLRGKVDAGATVCAGLGTAGAFSLWNRLSYGMAVRTAKKGLVIGLGYGIAQDGLRCLKGQSGGVFGYMGLGARRREARAMTGRDEKEEAL